jgi:hypothetical protein
MINLKYVAAIVLTFACGSVGAMATPALSDTQSASVGISSENSAQVRRTTVVRRGGGVAVRRTTVVGAPIGIARRTVVVGGPAAVRKTTVVRAPRGVVRRTTVFRR